MALICDDADPKLLALPYTTTFSSCFLVASLPLSAGAVSIQLVDAHADKAYNENMLSNARFMIESGILLRDSAFPHHPHIRRGNIKVGDFSMEFIVHHHSSAVIFKIKGHNNIFVNGIEST